MTSRNNQCDLPVYTNRSGRISVVVACRKYNGIVLC